MPADAARPVSDRIQLARLAEQMIMHDERVGATAGADERWLTADGERSIAGVTAAEDGAGHVEVELHLEALWPPEPFERIGEDLRHAMRWKAAAAGLGDRLGPLQINFHDVVAPAERVLW